MHILYGCTTLAFFIASSVYWLEYDSTQMLNLHIGDKTLSFFPTGATQWMMPVWLRVRDSFIYILCDCKQGRETVLCAF